MKKQILTKDMIYRRLRKNNYSIIGFGVVLLLLGLYTPWAILVGLLTMTLGVYFWIKDKHSVTKKDFNIILSPVNALDISRYSTDAHEADYIYFNFHDNYGRYRYCFSPNEKQLYQANEGDMYYLVFTRKRDALFTDIDCVFPAGSTILDDELSAKLQEDAYLTGYPLPKGMELKQKVDIRN